MIVVSEPVKAATLGDSVPTWTVELDDGQRIPWTNLQTGPQTLSEGEIEHACRQLLGCGLEALEPLAEQVLQPAVGSRARLPALILHSTTPDLKTFDGDLDALVRGGTGGDFTTYKEARSVYLARPGHPEQLGAPARPGDLAVGRTAAWRAAVAAIGAEAIDLGGAEHYYLSHALLARALAYRPGSGSPMARLVEAVRQTPRVVRLYAFERELQIFLVWLARTAGLDTLAVEANRPALSAAWNRKSVLHPTVARAEALTGLNSAGRPLDTLALEGQICELAEALDIDVPRVPGYTLEREGRSREDFVDQLGRAARLLRDRHGLTRGCLKASESGDGARIIPGLDLDDRATLDTLAREAHVHGDDYVLEAHVDYGQARIAGQTLPTALSAHVRGGEVAPGATIQFVEGTSWKGNVLLDESSVELFGVSREHYRNLRHFVAEFCQAFARRDAGLVLAGVDFAIGTVGGRYADTPLLGVQDLNVSFTGAECLRTFLDKAAATVGAAEARYGVTRIYRPTAEADHAAFQAITRRFDRAPVHADTVAAIPGRWGMVGITGTGPRNAIDNLNQLEAALVDAGLCAPPG